MSKNQPKSCCNRCGHPAGLIGYTYTEKTNSRSCFVLCSWHGAFVGQYRPFKDGKNQIVQRLIIKLELNDNGICQVCLEREEEKQHDKPVA